MRGQIEDRKVLARTMAEMREDVVRSLQLNRDLARLVDRALQLDQGMKVGWSRNGEPNPKQGEMGVAPGLPKGARLRMLGALNDCVAAFSTGGNFTLEGSAGDLFGAWNNGGNLSVERGVGGFLGHAMCDGRITVRDGAGDDAGSQMSGGLLLVRGDAGLRIGGGMSGGTIVVHGDVGREPGVGMTGGRIIINGRCPAIPEGLKMDSLSAAQAKKLNSEIGDTSLEVPNDAVCLTAVEDSTIRPTAPESVPSGGWGGIGLVNGGDEEVPSHSQRDTLVLLAERGGEAKAVGLPLPLIPMKDSGKGLKGEMTSIQPFIVRKEPRNIDLVILDSNNLTDCSTLLEKAGGVVLDLAALPTHSSPVLDGIVVSLRSILEDDSPIIFTDDVDRVERLHRSATGCGIDAVIARLGDSSGRSANSALPLVGRSAASTGLATDGILSGFCIDWNADATDLAISCAAGSTILSCQVPDDSIQEIERWLKELHEKLSGWLVHLGVSTIDNLTRKHLRALDHETASTSGLRLSGYGRPLPHWFAS